MAKRDGLMTRASVTEPPLWRKPWKGASMAATIKMFRNANPIFTEDEIREVLGEEYVKVLSRLVQEGELKRPARGIYCRVEYDQKHPEVELMMFLTNAKPATQAQLAKQADKAVRRMAAIQEEELRKKPATAVLLSKRWKVFSVREAWDELGVDPRPAITQLLAQGVIHQVHAGLYCKKGVPVFGQEVLAWGMRLAVLRGEIASSIDASQEMNSVRDGIGPAYVTNIRHVPKDRPDRQDCVFVNFARMGWIRAVAGGKGNLHCVWNSQTQKTGLTKNAAGFIAEQIFGRDILWGDLLALARKHHENPEKRVETSLTLPRFKRHSYLDYERRTGERVAEARFTALRQGRIEEGPLHPQRQCMLYIDHREDKRIIEALQGVENLNVAVVTLETGDYHAQWGSSPHEQILIERKTGPDFQATIVHRDLGSQIRRMAQIAAEGTRCFLLQQGDAYDVPPTQVDHRGRQMDQSVPSQKKVHSYAAMTAMGINVVPVGSWQDAAKGILDLICYSMTPSLLPWLGDPKTVVEETSTTPCENQENIAVSRQTAPSSGSTRSGGGVSPAM